MILSIIIVDWNVKPLLKRCLSSIFDYVKDLDYEVIVVDNASTDGSQEFLSKFKVYPVKSCEAGSPMAKFNRVKGLNFKVILNNQNNGFGKANNQALKQAKGKFILFLNPDTEITNGACQKIIRAMQENNKWGIVGCQLIGPDSGVQPSVRNFPTIVSQLLILLKLQYLFPRVKILKKYFQADLDYQKLKEVDQVAGTFIMTRQEVIKKVGSFDERFHLWFEDIDFCYRVKRAGWKVIYYPQVNILHHGGQSFWQLLSVARQRIYNKSMLAFFKKHFPSKAIWLLVICQPISLLLACLSEVFSPDKKVKIKKRLKID